MNLRPSMWFWTQKVVLAVFITIYLTMSLTPWYYNIGIKDAEEKGIKAIILTQINDSENADNNSTEFERRYVNNGSMSSLDLLIVTGYLVSMTYVYGLFLSSVKTGLIVNAIPLALLLIKTFTISNFSDVYEVSVRNVILWWACLLIYYMAFYLNDRTVITDIEVQK